MAFCNSCGATLDAAAKFCNKCGAVAPMTGTHPVAAAPGSTPAATPKGSNAVKIILIVVAVVVGLGIVGIGTTAFLAWRFAKSTHVEQSGDNVRVETPFGTVESNTDPDVAARNVGVDLYPGAKAVPGTTATMNIAGMHTAAAEFETNDPASAVAEFYKARFPRANFVSSDGDHYSIVSTDKKDVVTVNIEPVDGKTRIHISKVTGKADSDSSD